MASLSRRECLRLLTAGAVSAAALNRLTALSWAAGESAGCPLCFGTYGMPGGRLEESLETVAALGFDGVEIAVAPGNDGEPASMSSARRGEVRSLLADRGLRLVALMEHLYPAAADNQHQADLERLKRVMEMAHDLGGTQPPLIQTVLGGGTWEQRRELFQKRLADWQRLAEESQITLCIKPHRGGAMSQPAEAIWLIEQLGNSPRLRMVYDYSHYAFRDMPLEATIREAAPYTGYVAVKDAAQEGDKVVFTLPGASGQFDVSRMLRLFYDTGYRGAFCCEVSSMVSKQPNYDAKAAAATCYQNMAKAYGEAGVPRV